jgi:hypothetical protein
MVSVSWSHGPADPGRDPATAGQHALLLYLNFRVLTETLIVMLSLPFALVGGIWLMWWLGFNMPVVVAVGCSSSRDREIRLLPVKWVMRSLFAVSFACVLS